MDTIEHVVITLQLNLILIKNKTMSIRELYEYALIEMNKVEAPSLLLEDYNYFINKAVQQYINKVYNRYDINQQSTDDLRVLKATKQLACSKQSIGKIANKEKFVYTTDLPDDYMHLLNCVVEFEVLKQFKCYNKGDYVDFPAKRLTADLAGIILHNVYMKPDYKRPYFYINNVELKPTNLVDSETGAITYFADETGIFQSDISARKYYGDADHTIGHMPIPPDSRDTSKYPRGSEDPQYIADYQTYVDSLVEWHNHYMEWKENNNAAADSVKDEDTRKANASVVRLEVRFGDDDTVFVPRYIYVDYIKAPMFIRLTYDDITSTVDKTRMLEFPDYVCFEIVNEFVKLLMENASDPRLQTNFAVNQTIGDPTISNQQSQSKDKS